MIRNRWLGGLLLLSGACTSIAASADTPVSTETGVWQQHKYHFQFMGFTSTYSCDGLADKLALLLKYAVRAAMSKPIPELAPRLTGRLTDWRARI